MLKKDIKDNYSRNIYSRKDEKESKVAVLAR